jgi:hypothetical protein
VRKRSLQLAARFDEKRRIIQQTGAPDNASTARSPCHNSDAIYENATHPDRPAPMTAIFRDIPSPQRLVKRAEHIDHHDRDHYRSQDVKDANRSLAAFGTGSLSSGVIRFRLKEHGTSPLRCG